MPSQDELRALWASGIPLDDAWLEFTPDTFDAFMLRLLRTAPANDGVFERAADESVRKRYAKLKGWLPPTLEGRQAKLLNKIEVQRSYLLDNLYRGELWAIGFRTLANGFDELARVPRNYFFTDYEEERDVRPNVYWTKGELTAGSESYFDIHVVRSPAGHQDSAITPSSNDDKPPSEATSPARGGRPKTSDKIRETAEALLKNDRAFQALPTRSGQALELRARLLGESARHDHDRVGFKTSVIVRIIGEVARRLGRSEQTE